MSSKATNTGLASRIRAWARARRTAFTMADVCTALGARTPEERQKVFDSFAIFRSRGEIEKTSMKQKRRQKYQYNSSWEQQKSGPEAAQKQKICKAMRLISFHEPFSASDVKKMTGATRSYTDKVTKKLLSQGYITRVGFRTLEDGCGSKEALYRVVNNDRFRLEVIK